MVSGRVERVACRTLAVGISSGRYNARDRRSRDMGICLFRWRSNHCIQTYRIQVTSIWWQRSWAIWRDDSPAATVTWVWSPACQWPSSHGLGWLPAAPSLSATQHLPSWSSAPQHKRTKDGNKYYIVEGVGCSVRPPNYTWHMPQIKKLCKHTPCRQLPADAASSSTGISKSC